ncbi:MAG: undecaprenyl-diphosphatase [Clostridiales bacterium GWC2_40_7]|nr:MAG: undecaprenyl-diphosphatase [Clostridiales bacterium GWC2_40_7]
MNEIQGFILGLIQGLTEFLPISSSGHLALFQKIFGLSEGTFTFNIAVHLATLIGVMVVLKNEVKEVIRKPFGKLTMLVVAGTIPTVIIAAIFYGAFKKSMEVGATMGIEFIFTGLVLWFAETIRSKNKGLAQTTYTDAAVMGVAQAIAILPAVSRSGLTLAGALMRGLNREFALKLSFLMSIPAILMGAASDGYNLLKAGNTATANIDWLPLIIGFVTAGISGYFAVKFMIKIFSKTSLKLFSYYVFAIGVLILADQLFFNIMFDRLF